MCCCKCPSPYEVQRVVDQFRQMKEQERQQLLQHLRLAIVAAAKTVYEVEKSARNGTYRLSQQYDTDARSAKFRLFNALEQLAFEERRGGGVNNESIPNRNYCLTK